MIYNDLKNYFIQATRQYNTFEENVPAPYIRKSFTVDTPATAEILVAACGFYELFLNGRRYTKGVLAPYISNPNHLIYYDEYRIPLEAGENVLGLLLGNGFQNNPGGYIWDFDRASFRSAPMAAVKLSYRDADGEEIVLQSDNSFCTAPSPIRFDDYRFGEHYDANFEQSGWNDRGFDDSQWKPVLKAVPPAGDLCLRTSEPIVAQGEITPVKIQKGAEGFLYDFGVEQAGVCRLCVKGAKKGQKISLIHGEVVKDGKVDLKNIWFTDSDRPWERDKELVHRDWYICRGDEEEIYVPTFTYHGFRYVEVLGITPEQADEQLLTLIPLHSDLKLRGGFSCSDPTANTLQEITLRSGISNFHHFPTDCPQREKNGWTADAALSAEFMMLNYNPENSYRQWMKNICMAQDKNGALPGIVPTDGWGFSWGNGPAWDCVLAYLPYFVYVYRGDDTPARESSGAFMSYLHYLTTRMDERGLLHFGLGDWCHAGISNPGMPKAPLEVTDTIMAMDIAGKIAFLFEEMGMEPQAQFASSVAQELKNAFRKNLIDFEAMTVKGDCQTSQAMCLYYGVFNEQEAETAFARLLEQIRAADDHLDVGVLGGRVIFHVLSQFGYSDLAYKMITRPDFPSYGYWLEQGATTLWEAFLEDEILSLNHHFWGDISAWFIKCIAGIRFNPTGKNIYEVHIKPAFLSKLSQAQGYYTAPAGKIVSAWERKGDELKLFVEVPRQIRATVFLEEGYTFQDGSTVKEVTGGTYEILAVK